MTSDKKLEIIEYLRWLITTKDTIDNRGLCSLLYNRFQIDLHEIVNLRDWPEFSGNIVYPVPSINPEIDAKSCYIRCALFWKGEYGVIRRRLCSWVADQLEKESNE